MVFANSIGRCMDLSKHRMHGLIICHSFFFIVVSFFIIVFMLVYVDDGVLTRNNEDYLGKFI